MYSLLRNIFIVVLFIQVSVAAADGQRLVYLHDQMLHASGYKVRLAAALEIGKIADGSVTPHLLQAFQEESNEAVRLGILEALANIPSNEIFPPLLYIHSEGILSHQERHFIRQILLTHSDHIPTQLWQQWALVSGQPRKRALAALGIAISSQNPTHPWLVHLIQDPEPQVRRQAFLAALDVSNVNDTRACSMAYQHSDTWIAAKAKQCLTPATKPLALKPIARIPLFETATPLDLASVEGFFQSQAIVWQQSSPNQYIEKPINDSKAIEVVYNQVIETATMQELPQKRKAYPKQDQAMVNASIQKAFAQMNHCYVKALVKSPTLHGQLHFTFALSANGIMERMEIQKQSIADPECLSCMKNALQTSRFKPLTTDGFEATYRFTFNPPEKKKIEF